MRRYVIRVKLERLFNIPLKTLVLWVGLGILALYCTSCLFASPYRKLENLHKLELHIDDAYLIDSHDTKGSRMKLVIISGEKKYYLWYPSSSYAKFASKVETDLIDGTVTSVTALVADDQSIRDTILRQNRIVDLRGETEIYYHIDTERIRLASNHTAFYGILPIVMLIWMVYTISVLVKYRVIKLSVRR